MADLTAARQLADMLGDVADATGPNAAADIARNGSATIRRLADEVERLTADRDGWKAAKEAVEKDVDKQWVRAINAEDKVERLRAALNEIDALDPEHLIDSCAQTVLRGLVLRMGDIARTTLKEQPK